MITAEGLKAAVSTTLQKYVEREILPCYDSHDAAHRRDHALTVIDRSLTLAHQLRERGEVVNSDMAYAIAAYHDTGLCRGREHHHLAGGEIVRADQQLRQWFSEEEIETMAQAVEDHRASATKPPRSVYGCIVAEADRVIEPEVVVRRTIQYGLEHYPTLPREGHYARMVEHLKEKYGPGGYLRLWLPQSHNTARLATLRRIIADDSALREMFDRLFATCGG